MIAQKCLYSNTDEVMSAKEKEIENWRRNGVYEEVNDVG